MAIYSHHFFLQGIMFHMFRQIALEAKKNTSALFNDLSIISPRCEIASKCGEDSMDHKIQCLKSKTFLAPKIHNHFSQLGVNRWDHIFFERRSCFTKKLSLLLQESVRTYKLIFYCQVLKFSGK